MEQLLEAGPFVADLLARCPRLRLLATSRAALHLAGEQEYALPPLDGDVAVQLFADRARSVDRRFTLEEHRAAAVSICERLDRIPLGLELAAARIRMLSPEGLLERLDRALPVLTGGARDLPERQRTLRATIDWSHALLTSAEQRAFASVAVFASTFGLDAAEAVSGATLDELTALVEHSLVRRHAGANGGFRLLHVIREYAHERLEERGDATETHLRHGQWCLDYAGDLDARSGGDAGEHQLLCDLALALTAFWQTRGHLNEALEWFEHVLARPRPSPSALATTTASWCWRKSN